MERMLCILSGMNAGGAETFLMKIYRELDRSKYQLDFAINEENKCFYEDEINDLGGYIFRFPAKSKSFGGYFFALSKIIRENKYRYVLRITSNSMGFLDLAIAKFAGATKCIARSSNSGGAASLKSKIAHYVGSRLFKKFVDVRIAPSQKAAVYTFGINDYNSGKVNILPNGLDLDYYQFNENGRLRVRREFGIDENTIVLGHVGRFSSQKNHSFLIEMFSKYYEKNANSKLLLVGDGEMKKSILEKVISLGIQNAVIMAGIRPDMPDVYSAMDVLVFPSLYEGMPNTVIEAQACGLNCIVSDTITHEACITKNVTYLPIDSRSILKWVECAEHIPTNRQRNNTLFSEYNIHSVVAKFEKLVWG